MMAMMGFTVLVLATLAATAVALLLDWLLLRAVFHLMMPPVAHATRAQSDLVRGTVQLTRAFAGQR